MTLITPEIRKALVTNGKLNPAGPEHTISNVPPVCWIYDELSRATWLLTEIDRNDPDRAWGLVDAGDGKPDFEAISLAELEECRRPITFHDGTIMHLGTHRLDGWSPKGPLSAYIAAAARAGRIVDLDEAVPAAA